MQLVKALSQMNSSAETWVPGQRMIYHPDGSVIQHPSGNWYVRENGGWRLMTAEELYSAIGLSADTTYYMVVRAYNGDGDGESGNSNEIQVRNGVQIGP